jgi:hypothetical protein
VWKYPVADPGEKKLGATFDFEKENSQAYV